MFLRAALVVLQFELVVPSVHAEPAAGSIVAQDILVPGLSVIDNQQNVYVASGGFGGGLPPVCNPMLIAKIGAGGLAFRTEVNGPNGCGPETGIKAIALDAATNIYVAGNSYSPLATTPNAAQPTGARGAAFAAKLSADGSRFLYMTYLPSELVSPAAIGVDGQGNAYIAGITTDFHPFVTKLNQEGTAFVYTVRFPGSGTSQANPDRASALAVDPAGNVVVTGRTSSPDFPVTAGSLPAELPGTPSAFVARLDPGGKLVFSTFLGGAGGAYGQAVQVDSTGSIYVGGGAGAGFPTTSGTYEPAAVVPLWSEGTVGFVAKLRPDGSALTWATYVMSNDVSTLALNAAGEVYLASTAGAGFLTTASAPQPCFGGDFDVVVVHLDARGGLADATYLGAPGSAPSGLAVPADGSVLVAATRPPCSSGPTVCAAGDSGPVLARIRFGQAGWSAPACLSPDIVNAANFISGGSVSPGEFVSLTGYGIGPESGVVYQPGPHGEAPLELGGVQVTFNGIPAPLVYVQSRQANAQVPFEVSGSTVSVALTYNGTTFGPYLAGSYWLGPGGIFRLQPGVSTQAAALNQDGSLNGPANPAPRGSVVTLFGTGYGPLVPPCATGGVNPPGPVPLYYTGSIVSNGTGADGTPGSLAVEYAGSAPTLLCGIVQINVRVPLDAPSGPYLLATNGGGRGNGSTIFVQ